MTENLKKIIIDGNFKMPLIIINILAYYIIPAIVILSYFSLLFLGGDKHYKFALKMGEYAWWLLAYIMLIKPISQIFKELNILKKIMIRKQLGILTAYLFLVHAIGTIIQKDLLDISKFTGLDNYLLWGFIAGIIIIILGLTSNIKSIIFLNKITPNGWKKLHYTSYLAVIFASTHIYLSNGQIFYIILPIVFIILKIIEFKKISIPSKSN